MKIKTIGIKYPQIRLVLDKVKGIDYLKVENYVNPFLKRLKRFEVWRPLLDLGVDGYHTVNTVMLTKKPWCCSFEDYVPRGNNADFWKLAYWGKEIMPNSQIDRIMKVMLRPNCKRLIALSECNLQMQLRFYEHYNHPEITDTLCQKTCMLKVPQEVLVSSIKKEFGEKIKFVFVGNDFLRKGGREILDVFRELRKVRQDFELYMVTILENYHNYKFGSYQDTKQELDEITNWAKNQRWIHIYSHIPNTEVLEILKKCDVGMLPTWFDTYGYSVLEMEACGLPCITTNIRALPEINKNGWLLNLPVNFNNEVIPHSHTEIKFLRESMQKQIYDIVNHILNHHELILQHGQASFDYIKRNHSLEEYARKIAEIYNEFKEP